MPVGAVYAYENGLLMLSASDWANELEEACKDGIISSNLKVALLRTFRAHRRMEFVQHPLLPEVINEARMKLKRGIQINGTLFGLFVQLPYGVDHPTFVLVANNGSECEVRTLRECEC